MAAVSTKEARSEPGQAVRRLVVDVSDRISVIQGDPSAALGSPHVLLYKVQTSSLYSHEATRYMNPSKNPPALDQLTGLGAWHLIPC